ncbi:hypothetical protein [Treponema sp.]|uniref:hypothetical protein n=1 Tax=Treponema sp. TaxID=166 RepID=UPI003FD82DB6
MPVSDSQRKASEKYLEKLDDIKIRVPSGERQKYKDFAAANGYSLNGLVVALLNAAMSGAFPLPRVFVPFVAEEKPETTTFQK